MTWSAATAASDEGEHYPALTDAMKLIRFCYKINQTLDFSLAVYDEGHLCSHPLIWMDGVKQYQLRTL